MKLYNTQSNICFDDILLVPKASDVISRRDVDLSMSIGFDSRKIDLYLPIIAAPMDTVCESDAALVMAQYGGLGIIHRFSKDAEQNWHVNEVASRKFMVGAAVGVSNTQSVLPKVESLIISGARVILVDAANGHNVLTVNTVREIRRAFPDVHIMSGNVSTWDGFLALSAAGADSIRVGIGGGSMCTTRIATGHGMPTLSSIMEVYEMQERLNLPTSIIADGGIRNSGDATKAFAAGADAVMLGNALAAHNESPGKVVERDGKSYKVVRGMASEEVQKAYGKTNYVEGVSTEKLLRGSLGDTLDKFRAGISSGCSYSGTYSLSDLQLFSEFIKVTTNSVKESNAHGL